MIRPAFEGYLADPFLLRIPSGYVAYGSGPPFTPAGGRFRALVSDDLREWRGVGTVMRLDAQIGTDCWAPEVVEIDGTYWMYYSAGWGIERHHLRAACSSSPLGPFVDVGVDLTPGELFAIDPHVFTDADGSRYLFFAHDVLEAERPGTHIAVARLSAPDRLDEKVRPVLAPNADWQRYQANRRMYGRSLDWHTLEGPTVVARDGTLFLFYSGGSWEGPGYGVSYATATSVLGPWTHLQAESPAILSSASTGLIGPGHNSVLRVASDRHVTAFHAWDDSRSRRQMYITSIDWHNGEPVTAT